MVILIMAGMDIIGNGPNENNDEKRRRDMSQMSTLDLELRAAGIDPEGVDLEELIVRLKGICQEIGCSGLSPDMCQNKPYQCGIIRKLIHCR
jgi:hypothetical protein